MKQFENYKSIITKEIKVQSPTDRHNTLCAHPQCYSNCHAPCHLAFSLDPKDLTRCSAFIFARRPGCMACGHSVNDHRHYNSSWNTENDVQIVIDKEAERKFMEATKDNAKQKAAMKMLQFVIDKMGEGIAEATTEVGALAESYAELSLSGSFEGQVKKSVRLLELHLANMQGNGTDAETIGIIEESLNTMKAKLKVVEDAAVQTKKVSKFNYLKMVVSNRISRLRSSI
jgi:hypothetical protein